MQIMGKEFRTIDQGLDPDQVIEFLKAAVGSSEDSFERLEQFSALQTATRAMEESISQARQMAESAKKQAEVEVQQESERTLHVAREQAQEMVDQAKNNCAMLIDDVRTVLTDAIYRAFEIAKETVSINLEDLDNAVHRVGVSHHNQILINRQQSNNELSIPPTDTVASVASDETEEELEEEPDTDLMDLEKSLADLENSLTSLHASAGTVEDAPELQSPEEPEQNVEKSDEQPEAEVDDDKAGDDDSKYSGEVLVAIPKGGDDSWMQELRQRVRNLPGARIKAESGMDDSTTIVTLSLDEPVALRSVLQEMPYVAKVVGGQVHNESADKGRMKLLNKISKKLKHPTFIVELDRTLSNVSAPM